MRINNDPIDFNTTDLSQASATSSEMWLGHVTQFAFQVVMSGAPVGTLKVQFSCDEGQKNASSPAIGTGVTNWTDLPSASIAISAAGTYGLNLADSGYNWIRLVYTRTSGSGTIESARINTKGV